LHVAFPMGKAASAETTPFRETHVWSTPIRDLGLKLEGTALEPVVDEFLAEVGKLGLKVKPRCYLSTEWGVPFGTVAIAIPFYLASPELTKLHEDSDGFVEGIGRRDILRYLRHELGHVVNYAYKLYEREEWIAAFGAITRPYRESYRPRPFSREHVRHLPGWYAQKHPDEDWAETFAVWMTPGLDWRSEYRGWKGALAKLQLCDRVMKALRKEEPQVTADDLDEDVGELPYTLAELYGSPSGDGGAAMPGLDGALRTVFDAADEVEGETREAAALVRRVRRGLPPLVYRWTGHFPEHTVALLAAMARRAEDLALVYAAGDEAQVERELTVLVTALAMNHVHAGGYLS
jgi:hypothetical protein